MKVQMTEYLDIDLTDESWVCRGCGRKLISARENYKHGCLVYDRDPREIHIPLIDVWQEGMGYAPDPEWCRIIEFYCPGCGVQVEVEYLPPGHPITHDIEVDLDSLRELSGSELVNERAEGNQ
ncbi:MAG: acetone carboxylase subunit gamma [Thermoleophilia bacterium]|nr:acetone carboxylase subunit gamma [Thermoleophilia bacterium]